MDIEEIVKSAANYDKIVELQTQFEESDDLETVSLLAQKLVAVYGKLAQKGEFSKLANKKVRSWLEEQLKEFENAVISKIETDPALFGSVLLKLALLSGKYRQQSISPYIRALVAASLQRQHVFSGIANEFLQFDDLRYELYTVISESSGGDYSELIDLLCGCEKVVKIDKDVNKSYINQQYLSQLLPFESKRAALKYRTVFQKAWLNMLNQPNLNMDEVKTVLTVMHERIVPNMAKPQLIMDFLVSAYEFGGAVSLLSLNAVFVLIQHHQLDYPDFFKQLYRLLEDGSVLSSAHRARFLRLLDLFMTSTHIPAAIPASFVKRLARLCLYAPPGAIISVIPFVYNQLKRHPNCMVMIHRPSSTLSAENDPFDNFEPNPLATNALDSSLWELSSLSSHYHPNVAALARIMSQPFTKPQYNIDHFLSHSYETLYTTERRRKRDKEPALEYDEYNVFNDTIFSI